MYTLGCPCKPFLLQYWKRRVGILTPCSSEQARISPKHPTDTLLITRSMGPTWGQNGADKTQVGPMLVAWTLISGTISSPWEGQNLSFYIQILACVYVQSFSLLDAISLKTESCHDADFVITGGAVAAVCGSTSDGKVGTMMILCLSAWSCVIKESILARRDCNVNRVVWPQYSMNILIKFCSSLISITYNRPRLVNGLLEAFQNL